MKSAFLILLVGFLCVPKAYSQKKETINWITWEQLDKNLLEKPKPVFIFFHAKWCAYCKKMEREVFTNSEIVNRINQKYYAVQMDVETNDTILFDGKTFTNKQSLSQRNGVHELPLLLASREKKPFTLPAILLFNENFEVANRMFTYLTSGQLKKLL